MQSPLEGRMASKAQDRQPCTIHYRRLEDVTGAFGTDTLESAVRKAMGHEVGNGKVSAHWKHRAWVVPPSSEETLLMNVHHDGGKYFFGDLTQYTKGYMQTLISDMADTAILPIEQQPPPAGKEYIHSMMYWMIIGSHALIIQSRSLASKQLEEYLTWLLKDRTTAILPTGQVILQAKFDASDVGGDLSDIKEIIVGGRTGLHATTATDSVTTTRESYKEVATRKPWRERAVDVLRAVMNNEADVQKLLKSIPKDADLQVAVHIGYKAKREVTRAPMQQALRNLPEGEIKAIGQGGRMTGTDIRLSHQANILKKGNLLDPADVVRAFQEAYQFLVANGKIEPAVQ